MQSVVPSTTDVSVTIRIVDSTTFLPEEGVTAATGGLALWYRKGATGAVTAITEADHTNLTDAHSDGKLKHIDDGYYRLDLEDAAVPTAEGMVTVIGGTATDMLVLGTALIGRVVPLAPTTAGRALDVSAGGEAGIDWANIGSPTTAVNLSATTVKTATDVETDTADIQARLPAALTAGGNIKADVLALSGDATAADNLEAMLDGTGGVKLHLSQLNIVAASNDPAILATGSGTGAGIEATGGATGQGVKASGGATSGAGLLAIGSNGNANGATFTGQGSAAGLQITGGATGHGLIALGGATSGNGARFAAANSGDGASFVGATNGHGANLTGAGTGEGLTATGGATGHGIAAIGGATSGDGISASVTGAANNGMTLTGGASGKGLSTTILAALANFIADHVLRRQMDNVEASTDGDALDLSSLYGAVQQSQEAAISGATLTVKKTDGATTLGTKTITTDAAADPIVGIA